VAHHERQPIAIENVLEVLSEPGRSDDGGGDAGAARRVRASHSAATAVAGWESLGFHPKSLEQSLRCERALKLANAEMRAAQLSAWREQPLDEATFFL